MMVQTVKPEGAGVGRAGRVGVWLEQCLNGRARRVRAVQEPRRLGRAGSARLEAIRPDQVRVGGGRMQSGAVAPRLR
jgi:hypothetical protein